MPSSSQWGERFRCLEPQRHRDTKGAGAIEDDSGTDNEIKRRISMSVPRLLRPLCVSVSLWFLTHTGKILETVKENNAMRSSLFIAGVVAVAVVTVLAGNLILKAAPSTGSIPLNCNRACLENLVEQYMTALVAHDPKRLPLSKDVMYTENDQAMEIGDGFWKTVEGR